MLSSGAGGVKPIVLRRSLEAGTEGSGVPPAVVVWLSSAGVVCWYSIDASAPSAYSYTATQYSVSAVRPVTVTCVPVPA